MIPKMLEKFLKEENANYKIIRSPASAKEHARAILVKAGGKNAMVVIPAAYKFDLEKLRVLLETSDISLMSEREIAAHFPDFKEGVLPPIGRLYNIPCFVDETLLDGESVVFDSGKSKENVQLSSDEYWRIAQAEVGDFRVR